MAAPQNPTGPRVYDRAAVAATFHKLFANVLRFPVLAEAVERMIDERMARLHAPHKRPYSNVMEITPTTPTEPQPPTLLYMEVAA